MERPPRRPETPVLTRVLSFRIGLVSLMLLLVRFWPFQMGVAAWPGCRNGAHRRRRYCLCSASSSICLIVDRYVSRCSELGVFSNRWLVLGVVVMALLQILFTYSPVMNKLFGSAPMGIGRMGLGADRRIGDLQA